MAEVKQCTNCWDQLSITAVQNGGYLVTHSPNINSMTDLVFSASTIEECLEFVRLHLLVKVSIDG